MPEETSNNSGIATITLDDPPRHDKTSAKYQQILAKNRKWKKDTNYYLKRRENYAKKISSNPERYRKYLILRAKRDKIEAAQKLLTLNNEPPRVLVEPTNDTPTVGK